MVRVAQFYWECCVANLEIHPRFVHLDVFLREYHTEGYHTNEGKHKCFFYGLSCLSENMTYIHVWYHHKYVFSLLCTFTLVLGNYLWIREKLECAQSRTSDTHPFPSPSPSSNVHLKSHPSIGGIYNFSCAAGSLPFPFFPI